MPSLSPSYAPLLFVKEITFSEEFSETLVWEFLLLRSIRILWVFCVGGEDKFASGDGRRALFERKKGRKIFEISSQIDFLRDWEKTLQWIWRGRGWDDVEHRGVDKVNQFIDIVLTFVERMWVEMLILLSLTH